MNDTRNGKHVNFRRSVHELLMGRAKNLAAKRGLRRFPGLTSYLVEASDFFERKRDV